MNRLHPRSRSFTLIELLAVTTIATMVVAIAAVSIGNAHQQSLLASTVGALQTLDTRARLLARTSGAGVLMIVDPVNAEMRLSVSKSESTSEFARVIVPASISISVKSSRGQGEIRFERTGASDDYTIALSDGVSLCRVQVAGLSGEMHITREAP